MLGEERFVVLEADKKRGRGGRVFTLWDVVCWACGDRSTLVRSAPSFTFSYYLILISFIVVIMFLTLLLFSIELTW